MAGMEQELALVREVFLAEAEEHLETLEQAFLSLERTPDAEGLLDHAFGAAHTLKGAAGMVGFPAVMELGHALEDLLVKVRGGALPLTPPRVSLLLQGVDALRGLVRSGGQSVPSEVRGLQQRLSTEAQGAADPAAATAPGTAAPAPRRREAPTLRVGLDRLDRMLTLTGEIGIARGRLTAMLEEAHRYTPQELLEAHRDADRLCLDLQELVMKVRMLPFGRAFHPFERTVRDLALATGKQVRLELAGEDVEVDTVVLEALRDPLTHMVRNALDHGLEAPEARLARGKAPTGTLRLSARHEAGGVVVEVEDDGAGLDRERLCARARAVGRVAQPEALSEAELFALIFEPGFSTAEAVTELSGRGMGMSVVKQNVEALRGTLRVESQPGRGTRVRIRLPLTLALIDGLSVGVGEETYVLPLDNVLECVELPAGGRPRESMGILSLRGQPLPYLRLRAHLGVGGTPPAREHVVVLQHEEGRVGLAVDTLHGQAQTVIKPLGHLLQGLPGVAGSAILGNGRVALILDVPSILERVRGDLAVA